MERDYQKIEIDLTFLIIQETGRKRKRKGKKDKDSDNEEEREDGEAYARIKDGIAQGEEDHLDMDLK